MKIAPGETIRDNDPRMPGRTLRIVQTCLQEGVAFAWCEAPGGRMFRINFKNIYTDGKPRRRGFSLVQGGAP